MDKGGPTRTYREDFLFGEQEDIYYLILRYLNTGGLPFKELAEEWLHEGDV